MAIFSAIAAAVAAISAWTISLGALGSFAIGNFLLRAAVQLGVSALTKALAGGNDAQADPFVIQGSVRTGGTVARSFMFGPSLTAGSLVWHTEWGKDGGTKNAYYTQVIALSDLPVSGLRRWFIDGQAVTLSDVAGEYGFAAVEFNEGGKDHAWVRFHDGTQVVADPFLTGTVSASAPREYSASRVGVGVAYAVVTFRVNQEIFTGFPSSKFVLDGVKLYDVSKDETQGGTGAHRWDDPTTWGGDGDALPAVQAYNLSRGLYYGAPGTGGGVSESSVISLDSGMQSLSLDLVGGGGSAGAGILGLGGPAEDGGDTVAILRDGDAVVEVWTAAGGVGGASVNTTGQSSARPPYGNGGKGRASVSNPDRDGGSPDVPLIRGGGAGAQVLVSEFDVSELADPNLEIIVGASGYGAGSGHALYSAKYLNASIDRHWFYGLQGVTAARLPAGHWISQISKCRALVDGEDGLEPMYRCAGEVAVDSEIGAAFEAILTSCAGRMSEIGGVFKIYVGAPDGAIAHFTDGDIVSLAPQTFTPFFGLSDTINGVIAEYPSPVEGYVMRSLPPLYRPDFELQDGSRRLMADVSLSFVPFPVQAQRLVFGELAAARRTRRHTFTLPARFRRIEPGDVVTWTSARNGYDAKTFRVDGVIDLPDCDLVIDITEVEAADHGSFAMGRDYVPLVPSASVSVRPSPQRVVGFSPYADEVRGADGVARRPVIVMQWETDIDAVTGILFEVRLAASIDVVALAETRDFERGALPVELGLMAATDYQVRAKYIPSIERAVEWSEWVPVRTSGVGVPTAPVVQSVGVVATLSGDIFAAVDLAHVMPGSVAHFEVDLVGPAGFNRIDRLTSIGVTNLALPPALPGAYSVTVVAVGFNGERSIPFEYLFTFPRDVMTPLNVPGFRVRVSGDLAQLSWAAAGGVTDHYHVRFLAPGLTGGWAQAVDIDADITGRSVSVSALPGRYLIKAVSVFGAYSVAASVVQSGVISLDGLNVVEVIAEGPDFSGARSPGVKSRGGNLELRSAAVMADWPILSALGVLGDFGGVEPFGEYHFAAPFDLGEIYTSRLTARVAGGGYQITGSLSGWPVLSALGVMSGAGPDASDLALMMRTTLDDPAAPAPVWSEWASFAVGDYTARAFEFKLEMRSLAPGIAVRVTELEVSVDMPDRVEGGDDITCPPEGVFVAFSPPFRARPAISVDGQELPSGARSLRSDATKFGFHQQFVDELGEGLTCSFDWVAKGYGRAQ